MAVRAVVAGQDLDAADGLAQLFDLACLGIERRDRRAVGIHLRVQGDEDVHGLRIDHEARPCRGPHLVPGFLPIWQKVVAEHRRALHHAVDELVRQAAQRAGRNVEREQAIK